MRAFSAAVEDWHGTTEDDHIRALPFIFATFKLFENVWFQQPQGTLDPQQWEGWDVYIRILSSPGSENMVGNAASCVRGRFPRLSREQPANQ